MSISSAAFFTPAKAASTTASGEPTNVTTVRLVASPGSTSSTLTPPEVSMADTIRSITALSRPSLKLGTHSTIRFSICCAVILILLFKDKKNPDKTEKFVRKKGGSHAEMTPSGNYRTKASVRSRRRKPPKEGAAGESRPATKKPAARGDGQDCSRKKESDRVPAPYAVGGSAAGERSAADGQHHAARDPRAGQADAARSQ